jgi:SAM-dependent methyltransferase
MNKIVSNKELISFYKNAIKQNKSNKESLLSPVCMHFKEFFYSIKRKKNPIALDLAYGYGNYSIYLAKKGYKVDSIDIIPSRYFDRRAKSLGLEHKIKIIENNLNIYVPLHRYDFVIAKDCLHFLDYEKAISLLNRTSKLTNRGGGHYLTFFADIKREYNNGEKIVINNEANFKTKTFLPVMKKIYHNWRTQVEIIDKNETNLPGLEKPYNLRYKYIIWRAEKTN